MDSVISINDVLAQDLLARQDKEVREKDLISIFLLENKEWDFSAPTVHHINRRPIGITSFNQIEVIERFLTTYTCFIGVDMSNILIAGGSVTSGIIGISDKTADVDLFLYGISMEEVPARIAKLVNELNLTSKGKILKTAFATTIIYGNHFDKLSVQIIHRLYTSPSEVLHGFDLGSSSTGIILDENEVVTTSLGKVSLEYMINIWDETKRSTTYDARLEKYSDRNFSIVLPDLDTNKLKIGVNNLLDVELHVKSFKGNEINGFYNCPIIKTYFYDYLPREVGGRLEQNYLVTNLRRLLKGKELFYFKQWTTKEQLLACLDDTKVTFSHRDIHNYLCANFYSSSSIHTTRIRAVLTDEEAAHWVMRLFMTKGSQEVEDELKGILKERIEKRVANGDNIYKPHWVITNPASQITGSFHPRRVTKEMFYGEYLKA